MFRNVVRSRLVETSFVLRLARIADLVGFDVRRLNVVPMATFLYARLVDHYRRSPVPGRQIEPV